MSRKDKMFSHAYLLTANGLKWQVSIYHFTGLFFFALCFKLFHAFSLKSLPATRKGMKRVTASEFNTVKKNPPPSRSRLQNIKKN